MINLESKMNKSSLLESYKNQNYLNSSEIEKLTTEFRQSIVQKIHETFLLNFLDDKKTQNRLVETLTKQIKTDLNTVSIPYFMILENINLCVEVEMSQRQVTNESNYKFAEKKFTDILKDGLVMNEPIKRFAISEKKFLGEVVKFIDNYTGDYTISDGYIKIEFI